MTLTKKTKPPPKPERVLFLFMTLILIAQRNAAAENFDASKRSHFS